MNSSSIKFGTWISTASPVVTELAVLCGFDWVLLDLEHGCASEGALPAQLMAVKGSPTQAIVRVGDIYADQIGRLLDWGAGGIMVPHVEEAEDARRAVLASLYPPAGTRGYSRSVRAYDYGLRRADAAPKHLLIAQIESGHAVLNAGEIASVDGIDVLFVGPADLNFDLSTRGAAAPGTYEECLQRVVAAAAGAGKAAGILVREPGEVARHIEIGFTYIAVESDISILRKAYRGILSR